MGEANRVLDQQQSTPIRVLLVEDNFVNQAIAVKLLKSSGFNVETVENGLLALQLYQQKSFDVILMDIHMPGMDGFEATSRIRAYEKKKGTHTPIIAVTAHDDVDNRQRALAAGMDDFLPKPIRPSKLTESIKRLLNLFPEPEEEAAAAANAIVAETSTPPVRASIGLSDVLMRLDGDVALLQELAEAFIQDYSCWQGRFEEAVETGDLNSISHGARELQSSMRNFTITEALATTVRLEALSREGNVASVKQACSELDKQISPFISVLRGLVGRRREVLRS